MDELVKSKAWSLMDWAQQVPHIVQGRIMMTICTESTHFQIHWLETFDNETSIISLRIAVVWLTVRRDSFHQSKTFPASLQSNRPMSFVQQTQARPIDVCVCVCYLIIYEWGNWSRKKTAEERVLYLEIWNVFFSLYLQPGYYRVSGKWYSTNTSFDWGDPLCGLWLLPLKFR